MIKLDPTVKIIAVDSSCTESSNAIIKLCFNTTYSVISPKSILDLIFMFNGLFETNDIFVNNIGHADINSKKIIKEFLQCGIVIENRCNKITTNISNYTVHFPIVSNVNVMIAVLLQKLNVQCVFYHDSIISQDDVYENLYYSHGDIGKPISIILQNKMNLKTVSFTSSIFDETLMKKNRDRDIIINSNFMNWINSSRCVVINTWNYKNIQFEDFKIFNDMLDISDDLKVLIQDYGLAIHAITDMLYSINGVYV